MESKELCNMILDEIVKASIETFAALKCIFHGLRIHLVWNPEIEGMESTT